MLAAERIGAGPALVLLHGFTLDRRTWTRQRPLARWLTLVAPDRRGNGQSTAPPDPPEEPADILALADALGLERFALLGHSQGARVAAHVARAAPGRVSHLLLAGAPHDAVAEDLPRAAMAARVRAGRLDEMRALWRAAPIMAARTRAGRALRDRMIADYAGRDLSALHPPLALDDGLLAGLAAPVTILVGADDTAPRRAAAQRLAAARPGARLIVLHGAGHLAPLEAPRAFNAAVREALADRPAA